MRALFSRRQKPAKKGRPAQGTPATSTLNDGAGQTTAPPQAHTLPLFPVLSTTQTLPPIIHGQSNSSSSPRSLPFRRGIAGRHGGAVKKDYWKMAAENLQEEDPSLKELIAGVQRAAATAGNDDFATQLLDATVRSRRELESKRWKIHMGAKEIALRKHFDRLVKVVAVLKDVASAAASLDPIHAGLPLAGFCVLMQMATNDSDQYAAMVVGVEEVVTIVARYQHVEEIYRHRGATSLKAEFEQQLVSLYGHIIRYQVAASSYYRRNTLERYVRAMPKLDDLSEVTAAVRQQDSACSKITQLFDSADAMERHQEVVYRLDQFQQLLSRSGGPASTGTNAHWIVRRPTNSLFTGRDEILDDLKTEIEDTIHASAPGQQCRIIVTGIGGQGKSEICLQLAHRCRSLFWGVFWIDVGSTSLAEKAFLDLAHQLQIPTQTWEDACQGVGALQHPWLLVLDNADDPQADYSRYFPPSAHGVVLLTSRNEECARYATTKHLALGELAAQAARKLLLRAAGAKSDQSSGLDSLSRQQLDRDADVVATLLQSHPLALIQAGAYVARGHCTLAAYPQVYHQQRKRLLQFYPVQARSRYGDVHATFEASASILQAGGTEVCADALSLLPVLAAFERSRLPLPLFAAAWTGAQSVVAHPDGGGDKLALQSWHVCRLPSWMSANAQAWDSFRLIEAVSELRALSLVTTDSQEGYMSVSMHPLVHAWARDRQDEAEQHASWVSAGCVAAVSADDEIWQQHARLLQAHVEALTSWDMDGMFASEPPVMISVILVRCGQVLDRMRADTALSDLRRLWFRYLGWSSEKVQKSRIEAYALAGQNALNCGDAVRAVSLLEQVVEVQQDLAEIHLDRLASQHALAMAYRANGQVTEAVTLMEQVVAIRKRTLAETHPDRLASQYVLAIVYKANGQITEAVTLLEQIVAIEKRTLAETHPDRLTSQHALAIVYEANGQVTEAVTLLEQVVAIRKRTLAETHPDRLTSQHALAMTYQVNEQVTEAVTLMEQVVAIRKRTLAETHPDRLASQHVLAIVYKANGQLTEAVTLLEQIVAIKKRTLAETHPNRLASQHVLAIVYRANGQITEAVTLIEQVVAIQKRTLVETHRDRLASQHALAMVYEANGQVTEAVTLLEQVVAIRKRTLAETHPDRLTSQYNLATYLWTVGRQWDALRMMQHVVNIRERVLEKSHSERQASEGWLHYFKTSLRNGPSS